jgi:hypothetical protein
VSWEEEEEEEKKEDDCCCCRRLSCSFSNLREKGGREGGREGGRIRFCRVWKWGHMGVRMTGLASWTRW